MVDKYSYIFAGVISLIALMLVFNQTNELIGSLAAAILTFGLAWVAYVLMRWLVLSLMSRDD